MSEATYDQRYVLELCDLQRRYVIETLLSVEPDPPPGPPDPVRWQCVVAELADILGVEPAAFAAAWAPDRVDLEFFRRVGGMPDQLDYLRRAQLPERFEAAVLAELSNTATSEGEVENEDR